MANVNNESNQSNNNFFGSFFNNAYNWAHQFTRYAIGFTAAANTASTYIQALALSRAIRPAIKGLHAVADVMGTVAQGTLPFLYTFASVIDITDQVPKLGKKIKEKGSMLANARIITELFTAVLWFGSGVTEIAGFITGFTRAAAFVPILNFVDSAIIMVVTPISAALDIHAIVKNCKKLSLDKELIDKRQAWLNIQTKIETQNSILILKNYYEKQIDELDEKIKNEIDNDISDELMVKRTKLEGRLLLLNENTDESIEVLLNDKHRRIVEKQMKIKEASESALIAFEKEIGAEKINKLTSYYKNKIEKLELSNNKYKDRKIKIIERKLEMLESAKGQRDFRSEKEGWFGIKGERRRDTLTKRRDESTAIVEALEQNSLAGRVKVLEYHRDQAVVARENRIRAIARRSFSLLLNTTWFAATAVGVGLTVAASSGAAIPAIVVLLGPLAAGTVGLTNFIANLILQPKELAFGRDRDDKVKSSSAGHSAPQGGDFAGS